MALRIECTKWESLRTIVCELITDNIYLTPYSEYSFLDKIKNSANIHRRQEARKYKLKCYVGYDDEKVVFVAPLLINDRDKRICLLGEFSSIGHLDFIYSVRITTQQLSQMVEMVLKNYPGYIFSCDRISEFSLTKKMFDEKKIQPTERDICVKIDLSDYDEWYSNLTKSCRQNIRTSYNRLKNDNSEMSFELFVYNRPSNAFWNDSIVLFSKRILEHTKLPKILLYPMIIFKRNEAIGKALRDTERIIFANVYINNRLAAFMNGVIGNDGRAIITRLSIEAELGKYSPGGLLLNETIKKVNEKYDFIKSIDLSRGNEPYKYTYGGAEHYNLTYILKLGD